MLTLYRIAREALQGLAEDGTREARDLLAQLGEDLPRWIAELDKRIARAEKREDAIVGGEES